MGVNEIFEGEKRRKYYDEILGKFSICKMFREWISKKRKNFF